MRACDVDARPPSHQALEQVRRSAMQRVETGENPEFVGAGIGLNRRTIYRWLAVHHAAVYRARGVSERTTSNPTTEYREMNG